MRDLKFRAWDNTNNKMIIPGIYDSFHLHMTWTGNVYKEGKLQDYIFMQFTGLKDKNGKEMYFEDVVIIRDDESDNPPHAQTFKIVQDDFGIPVFYSLGHYENWDFLEFFSSRRNNDFEIIGNMYENPELLK